MNKVHLLYPKTDWRASHFFCMDVADGDMAWKEYVAANAGAKMFLWDAWKDEGLQGNITWVPRCVPDHFYASDNLDKRVQSWHLPKVCTAFGSMSVMLQLSILMGYEEIYLLGCDMWSGDVNHFDPFYTDGEDVDRRNRDNLYLHQIAKSSCPVPIINCTVGGNLEIYERRKLEDVLNGSN